MLNLTFVDTFMSDSIAYKHSEKAHVTNKEIIHRMNTNKSLQQFQWLGHRLRRLGHRLHY